MKVLKPIAMAFLFGGVFAVIGQAITMVWLPILGSDSPLLGFAILVTMGVIGMVMFATGLHQKLEGPAGFGLILPFNGMCAAVAGAFCGGMKEGGVVGGIKDAFGLVIYVVGFGYLSVAVVALIAFFVM